MSDFRTPLSKVRGLGAAGDGVQHWWLQRVTAVANIPLMIWFVVSAVALSGADYGTVVVWMQNPIVTVLLVLTIASLFYHIRLGLQVVVEDYVHQEGTKLACLIALTFATVALGLLGIVSVLRVSFGG